MGIKRHVICINGCPSSGKDTVGKFIRNNQYAIFRDKFAEPLTNINEVLLSGTGLANQFVESRNDVVLKNQPFFMGKTPREMMIAASEDFAKRIYGDSIFGELAALRVIEHWHDTTQTRQLAVYTDTGFQHEYDAFCARVKTRFPETKIHLIRVERDGFDFTGDSREYVSVNDYTHSYWVAINNGTEYDLRDSVKSWIDSILK